MAVADITDSLTHKIGPLPAWAWAAIPAVGYVGYSYYKAAQTPPVDTTTDTTPTSVDEYGLNTGGTYLPSYSATPAGSGNLPYTDQPNYDNATWYRQAINYLITQGISSSDAVTAINSYIYGTPATINSTQMNALQRAIAKFGAAPNGGFIPNQTAPAPTPTTTTKVPEPPTSVRATPRGTTATVAWGPPQVTNGTIIGYRITAYVGTKAVVATTTLGNARSYTLSGLHAKTTYRIGVRARNAKGYSAEANTTVRTP